MLWTYSKSCKLLLIEWTFGFPLHLQPQKAKVLLSKFIQHRPTCRSLFRMRPIAGKKPSSLWCLMSQDLAARSSLGSMKIKARDWAKDFSTNAVNLNGRQMEMEVRMTKTGRGNPQRPNMLWQHLKTGILPHFIRHLTHLIWYFVKLFNSSHTCSM